jgi:nucleoside-diphosphate-sugar epimerase
MRESKTVLLTGASGVVGSALVPELLNEGFKVVALVRKRPVADEHVINVVGDVTTPYMGLDVEKINETYGPFCCLIHSAALTNFNQAESVMHETNVTGTINAVAVANQLNARLLYVSTAYVHDMNLPSYLKEYSAYCKTKRLAEAHVKSHATDWTIVRPSIVVGDSVTGAISTFQGLHNVVGAILTRVAPMIPAHEAAYVDLVPQDVLARSISALARRRGQKREYWITRGKTAACVAQVCHLIEGFSQSCGDTSKMPRIVDPGVIDRLFKPVFLPSLPKPLRRRLNSLVDYACYFNMSEPFPSNYDDLANEFDLPPMPCGEQVLLKNLEYWAEQTKYKERVA